MSKRILAQFSFTEGYISSIPRSLKRTIMAFGSKNALLTGLGFIRAFRGFAPVNPDNQKGSTQFFQTDNSYAGLGSELGYGRGNIFKVQKVLAFVGAGAVRFNGQDLNVIADSTLKYCKKIGGNYAAPASQAGHARPTAPTIFPKNVPGAGKTPMNGSVVVAIHRADSVTGQVSNHSLASNVLVLTGQTVIVPFPMVDANAQDVWGLDVPKPGFGDAGVLYQLKTELGGEVLESVLAYTRTITNGTILHDSNTLDIIEADASKRFVSADIGRRITVGAFDSWITDIISPTQAKIKDTNAAADATNAVTVRHAVDGILRAVEISWTAESLNGQDLAPYLAYPPPSNISWAGILNDAMFVETDDGIIYVGLPGFIGSFPPKNTLFPTEPATCYLDGSDGVYWRFSKNTFSVMPYVGGTKPVELQTVWKNFGVLFPQNAAIGYMGRVIAWSGKPVRLGGGGREPETAFAFKVNRDFAGWNDAQTKLKPIIAAYDPRNQFEIYAFDKKIMCLHAPSDTWCAPVDVTPYLEDGDYLLAAVVVENELRFATKKNNALGLHVFDRGTGSTMVVKTPDATSEAESDTITQINAEIHVENTQRVLIEVIRDFQDDAPRTVLDIAPGGAPAQHFRARPNITNATSHCLRVTMETTGSETGIESLESMGESSGIFL